MADIVDIITKVGADASGYIAELDKINAHYKHGVSELRNQKKELAELYKLEEGLLSQRSKSNSPNIVTQFNQKLEENKAKIISLTKAIHDQGVEVGKTSTKLKENLDKAFDGTKSKALAKEFQDLKKELDENKDGADELSKTVVADVGAKGESAVKSLKAQLLSLKEQLGEATDPEQIEALLEKAGEIKGKIDGINTSVDIFSGGSKFEKISKAFGEIGQKLLKMDFEGAKKASGFLLDASRKITFKDAIGGIKQIGTTLSNIGKALLTNPLFLIGAAVGLLIKGFSDLTKSIDEGTESLKANAEAVRSIREETESLIKANRDLALQNEIDAKKISEVEGEKLKNQNRFKDEYITIQRTQREALKKFNEDMAKEREEDSFRQSKNLLEYFGFETEAQQRHKIGIREIESAAQDQIAALKVKFGLENTKILIDQANKEADKNKELNKKRLDEERENARKLRDLRISNLKDENDKQRLEVFAKYQDEVVAAKGNALIIAELDKKLARETEAINKDIHKKYQAVLDEGVKAQEAANDEILADMEKTEEERKAFLERQLDETQRHQTALLEIRLDGRKESSVLLLANEIAFERARLGQIAEFHGVESEEFQKQANKLEELQEKHNQELSKLNKQRTLEVIDHTKKIVDAAIGAANQILSAEISKVDKLISLQQKRVDDVAKIAEKGNAELLELEKERLDKLNKEREKYVRQQQALATIELIANTAVTISKAAAEGGAAAAVTIAAALIALIAGLASARSIAGQAAFYEGGYTGDGNPREESSAVGKRPYIYHKAEFVHDHKTTKKFKKIFQDVHEGKVDLNQMKFESDMYKVLRANGINTSAEIRYRDLPSSGRDLSELKATMGKVEEAIKGQSRLKVSIDKNGIAMIATEYIRDRKRINTIAR